MGGVFESLQQLVAAGFLPKDDTAALFERDYADGGLFLYTEVEKASVLRTNFGGKLGNRKYFDMVAYLMETGYDLTLDQEHNVSESPRFEGCELRFDSRKKATSDLDLDWSDSRNIFGGGFDAV